MRLQILKMEKKIVFGKTSLYPTVCSGLVGCPFSWFRQQQHQQRLMHQAAQAQVYAGQLTVAENWQAILEISKANYSASSFCSHSSSSDSASTTTTSTTTATEQHQNQSRPPTSKSCSSGEPRVLLHPFRRLDGEREGPSKAQALRARSSCRPAVPVFLQGTVRTMELTDHHVA
jgi:hypothetical protein